MKADSLPQSATVLVVDDEPVVCASCERILVGEGHRVQTTVDPRQGLRMAEELSPEITIVDLKMPELDGLEFLRRVKEVSPWTDVMIITGYAQIDTAVEAIKLGAFDYIPKPFSPDQLIIAVAKALERKKLQSENAYLRRELQSRYKFENIIGGSPKMQELFHLIEKVAPTRSTVLIRGESGTGKELIARAIHCNSPRSAERFLAVDCGALSETVLESEMFGHVKGAFTGAVSARKGFFEIANGGTLFLDEIGNISLNVQTRLLRVLQEREFKPVGAAESIETDIRIIAATNKDLERLVAEESFREELYYRLNIVPILIPPLRERREDIPLLARHFLEKHGAATCCRARSISPETMSALERYSWPGNVRELENALQRAMVFAPAECIEYAHLPPEVRSDLSTPPLPVPQTWSELLDAKRRLQEASVADLERNFVLESLTRHDGNATRTAEAVGMQRTQLQALMRKHGLKREVTASRDHEVAPAPEER